MNDRDLLKVDKPGLSFMVRHIMALVADLTFKELFGNQCVHWRLGKMDRISFWDDVWLGASTLHIRFPDLFTASPTKLVKVNHFWVSGVWRVGFSRELEPGEDDEATVLMGLLDDVDLRLDREDSLIWEKHDKGFSVSESYKCLSRPVGVRANLEWASIRWVKRIPPKFNVFIWLAAHSAYRLLTFWRVGACRSPCIAYYATSVSAVLSQLIICCYIAFMRGRFGVSCFLGGGLLVPCRSV